MAIALDQDFPRAYAETDRFRRGLPRTFEITETHVTFLRSGGPRDAQLSLWRHDIASGEERCLVDAAALHVDDGDLPAAERARRERLRESGAGITGYSQSEHGDRIAFTVGGVLWGWDEFGLRALTDAVGVFDPRIDGSGECVAFVADGGLRVVRFADGEELWRVAREGVSVGVADFAAAEELGRSRGHWWSPDGTTLLAEVVDDRPVQVWHIADPANPGREPLAHRYPAAGTANALCSLLLVDLASGEQRDVTWDRAAFEYLVSVRWTAGAPALVTLADRAQTRFQTFALDHATGTLAPLLVQEGAPWLDVVAGVPAQLPDGRLVHALVDTAVDTHRLAVDGVAVTPAGWQLSHVVAATDEGIVVAGTTDPRTLSALHIAPDGTTTELSHGFTHAQFASNGNVHVRVTLDGASTERRVEIMRGAEVVGTIRSLGERASMPAPQFLSLGERALHAAVLWPEGETTGPLPLVLSPYGGPHHLEVVAAAGSFAEDQWLANRGFCVLVVDGRGTPGRGPAWEYAIAGDFAGVTLADQVDALDAFLALHGDRVDAGRVGIRGWSYGGYLSALALLARPDRFHVGIAGAPVTDWALYDTAYTERYLGDPRTAPDAYARNALVHRAASLQGRLLIVHGLADDNVVSAHSLRLSGALLAAGRQHEFLPLAGVSHMTPQAVVTEHLMRLQAAYLQEHLRA